MELLRGQRWTNRGVGGSGRRGKRKKFWTRREKRERKYQKEMGSIVIVSLLVSFSHCCLCEWESGRWRFKRVCLLGEIGTPFMARLSAQLKYFIAKKVSEDSDWRGVEIILSGHEVKPYPFLYSFSSPSLSHLLIWVWVFCFCRFQEKVNIKLWSTFDYRKRNRDTTPTWDTVCMDSTQISSCWDCYPTILTSVSCVKKSHSVLEVGKERQSRTFLPSLSFLPSF